MLNRDTHLIAARLLAAHLGNQKSARILDVAAGTGLCGQEVLFSFTFASINISLFNTNMGKKGGTKVQLLFKK